MPARFPLLPVSPLPHFFRVHTPFVGRDDLGAPPGSRRATVDHRPLRLRPAAVDKCPPVFHFVSGYDPAGGWRGHVGEHSSPARCAVSEANLLFPQKQRASRVSPFSAGCASRWTIPLWLPARFFPLRGSPAGRARRRRFPSLADTRRCTGTGPVRSPDSPAFDFAGG